MSVVRIHSERVAACDACAERIRDALARHDGVSHIAPAGSRGMEVTYDPDRCDEGCLDRALTEARTDVESRYGHRRFAVEGMDCADCARNVERAVRRVGGVTRANVSYPAGDLDVEFTSGDVDADAIAAQVSRLGYTVPGHAAAPGRWRGLSRTATLAVASALTLIGLALELVAALPSWPWYAAAVLVAGLPLARAGVVALAATRRPTINLLMAVAAVGASAIGAWLEGALVVVLFSLGELLEGRAADRARRELTGLLALAPATARVRRRSGDGPLAVWHEVELPADELRPGDAVVVRPGEALPADGVVRDGASSVDQAAITGESAPVDKAPGDPVFAGTLNAQGMLLVEVTSAPGDTTLDRVAALVGEAQARRSPSERWVDAFAAWYTPAVMAAAAAVAVLGPLAGMSWGRAVYSALALLILACPCALVISTPVTIVSALGRASASGVVVKGGEHLERAASIRTVAFDKTGTLTRGRPQVADVWAADGDADAVLTLAAGVEESSEHPLGRAIVAEADRRGLTRPRVAGFRALTGLGASAHVDGREVTVGDRRLVDAPSEVVDRAVSRMREAGMTAVLVSAGGEGVRGVIGIADQPRDEAAQAVAELRAAGVHDVLMLTGDAQVTARAVAAQVGIAHVEASLLPADKAAVIAATGPVAMVGDGVNDAPALAAADLGVAMGGAGSDAAIEVADVAVMGDDPRAVPRLIGLARWTRAVVRQNIAFSLATKVAAAVLLAFGALPLWGAVVADVGSSLLVVANGLRVGRLRPLGRLRRVPMLTPSEAAPRAVAGCRPGDGCCGDGAAGGGGAA